MRRLFFLLLVIGLLAAGYYRWERLGYRFRGQRVVEKFTPVSQPKIDLNDVKVLASIDAEYSKLIDSVVPSVVAIRSRGVAAMDPLELFFRQRLGGAVPERRSLGSGVIVSKEGHILTNYHVIEGMSEIVVQLADGRTVPAQLIGGDKQVDIAVLRIDAPRLEALPLGNSDDIRVGQMVFAIGNPFGLQATVTQGIISAKGRAISDNGVEFLQTDAAVNQGNSGGPLLNLRGEVIGINSAIYSETGGWLGISFAIPSATARRALESIVQHGRIVRPFLGVLMSDITSDLAAQLNAPDADGSLIHNVIANSPADRAGLRPGDIVRAVNGKPVRNSAALRDRIASSPVGTKMELTFLRNGQEQHATAEIAESPADGTPITPQALQPPSVTPRAPALASNGTLAGVQVAAIPDALRAQLPRDAAGVVVARIDPSSRAAGDLRAGDVIEEVNRQPITSVADFQRVANSIVPEQQTLLRIIREGSRLFVAISAK